MIQALFITIKGKFAFRKCIAFVAFIAFIEFIAFIKNNITKEWTNPLIPLDKVEKDNAILLLNWQQTLHFRSAGFLGLRV